MKESRLQNMLRSRKYHRKWVLVFLLLAVLVSTGVGAALHRTGIAAVYTKHVLDCPYADLSGQVAHIHTTDCYAEDGTTLVCPLQELEAHIHTEDCYSELRTLTCTLEENPGHMHDESCYTLTRGDFLCTDESEDHEHTDVCYEMVPALSCGLEEGEGAHTHDDACYDIQQIITCGIQELPEHVHDAACFKAVELTEDEMAALGIASESPSEVSDAQDGEGNEPADASSGITAEDATEIPEDENRTEEIPAEASTVDAQTDGEDNENTDYDEDNEVNETDENSNSSEIIDDKDNAKEEGDAAEETGAGVAMPATSFEETAGDVRVIVEADEGVFPEGTTMTVEEVVDEEILGAVSEAVNGRVEQVKAVDITFKNVDGEEIQPAKPIRVRMEPLDGSEINAAAESAKAAENEDFQVVHVDADGKGEIVEQPEELTTEEAIIAEENNATFFDAEHFSVYAMVHSIHFEYEVNGEVFTSEAAGAKDILLSDIIGDLHIVPQEEIRTFISKISDVAITDPEVLKITEGEGDWIIRPIKNAEDPESLQITMQDEAVFSIQVAAEGITEVSTTDETAVISTVNDFFLPEDATAYANILDEELSENAIEAVQKAEETERCYQVFDIGLNEVDAKDYEAGFEVSLSLPETVIGRDFRLYHIHDGRLDELELNIEGRELEEGKELVSSVSFVTPSFSEFVLSYTVDFEYTVNGKTYQFTLPGGGFVSFEHLIEALGITDGSDHDTYEDEIVAETAKNESENTVFEGEEENGISGGIDVDSISLNDIPVSEETMKFVANVANVEFSDPCLVDVSLAETDTTVGQIKEIRGLECTYSAELTEDQIAEINSSTVEAGDWALISLQPFTSEETLTVTMKNGEQFVIKVIDAQIYAHVITADGSGFIITVTYGDNAHIPEGAVLEADEIVPGSREYEEYLAQAQTVLCGENRREDSVVLSDTPADITDASDHTAEETAEDTAESIGITFSRFFDIRIMSGEEEIEPEAPVQVSITYEDPLNVDDDQSILAVHFGENGTEIIDTSSDQGNKSVMFMQESFSVTGTIVTSGGTWPQSGSSNVMFVQSGDNYYAVAHDGSLHQVSVDGNNVTFPDDADTFDLNNYLWTYEQQQYYIRTNYFVYYLDSQGRDHYLAPNVTGGISEESRNVQRDSSGKIYYNPGYGSSSYIGVNGGSITGNQNSSNAVPIQFASDFVVPRKATIHFVDRNGNPLTGVSYIGSSDFPVTANADGTFSVPYNWDMGNSEYTLHLDTDFSKLGYTYASTHLAGTREGTALTYDGLTMDAALKERNNAMYLYTDQGNTLGYGNLQEININESLRVTNAAGTGLTDYLAANINKDIYVILDPVPANSPGQDPGGLDVKDPEFNKSLESNEDGTYTLSLNVTGHGINAATNPKANVLFVVDTSSSMDKTEGTGTEYSRLHDTKPALKTLASELLQSNSMTGKDPDTVEVAMISFDGGVVDEIGWTKDYNAFANQVDTGLALHRGTDWEDALDRAYILGLAKQAEEPDQQVFVVFFTDGEASQYRSFHGQGSYNNITVNPNYARWYSYFLSRESAKDEARAIVNAGMQFYAVYAFNPDNETYGPTSEKGSDLLQNVVKYAYNSADLGSKNYFANATSTEELHKAFNSILLSVREYLGFSDVVMNDDVTSLTSTGINLVSSAVGGFTYTRSGGRFGSGQAWTEAPAATHTDSADGNVTSVKWDLGSTVLEDGVTYTVSFKVWPSQEAYDWLANLQNGTKTWDDVVEAGLDAPNGSNPQIIKNGNSYSLLTNKPSLDSDGKIINNVITYKKTHSETVTEESIPPGTQMGVPIEGTDADGNKTITTYTVENSVYTKTVVTEKKTYFKNPDPMPLEPESMNVLKKWETSMNTSHPADELKFRVLVDGKYYQNDGSLIAGDEGLENAKVLPVSGETSWTNSIIIAPGIVKYYDDDGNALSEALVLETGHKYTLEEFDLMENGSAFLYYTSYEFHSQTMRPMIIDGTLQYLVLVDEANPKPDGAQTYVIGTETYFVAASGSGQGSLSGTNYRTAELDITKIIQNSSGVELTDEELNAQSFTYRVTLSIPDGTDPAGIVGYEYVPRIQDNAYTLFGYQTGETAFESDIKRFSGKTFRAWNTLVYRDLVEWENVGGRIISKTDENGNIIWKVPSVGGYHTITYDMTLNRNEVIRFTNLPTGTQYSIQEKYANYYQADNSEDSAGHSPIDLASNITQEGYEITQILTTNGTVSRTEIEKDTVSGTVDTPNVRYYNQFTNDLKSVKVKVTVLKTNQDGTKPLPGAVFDLYDEAGYDSNPKVPMKTGLTSSSEEGKEGTIDLGRLVDGVYYLVETSAPAGFIPLTDPVIITVNKGTVTYSQGNSTLDDNGTGTAGDFHIGYQLTVINDEGVVLPMTGGIGTGFFTGIGGLMTATAGAILTMISQYRKRRETETA